MKNETLRPPLSISVPGSRVSTKGELQTSEPVVQAGRGALCRLVPKLQIPRKRAGSCARKKMGKPGARAAVCYRILTHEVSCPNSTKACQKIFQALRGLITPLRTWKTACSARPAGDRRSPTAMLSWRPPNGSLFVHYLSADAEPHTNVFAGGRQHPSGRRLSPCRLLPAAKPSLERNPSETLSDSPAEKIRARFGPLRLSRAKYEYTFRTA